MRSSADIGWGFGGALGVLLLISAATVDACDGKQERIPTENSRRPSGERMVEFAFHRGAQGSMDGEIRRRID